MAATIVEDVAYHRDNDGELLARLYRPAGNGPFPVADRPAWRRLDQRRPHPERRHRLGPGRCRHPGRVARFPHAAGAALSRDPGRHRSRHPLDQEARRRLWRPRRLGRRLRHLERRAFDPAGGDAPTSPEARLAYVISGWGVLDPLLRYRLAKERGAQSFVGSHDAFWGSEAAMTDGSPPAILERGDQRDLPPALIFQGDADEWVPQDMTEKFVAAYRKAGGEMELEFLPGAKHGFFREDSGGAEREKGHRHHPRLRAEARRQGPLERQCRARGAEHVGRHAAARHSG